MKTGFFLLFSLFLFSAPVLAQPTPKNPVSWPLPTAAPAKKVPQVQPQPQVVEVTLPSQFAGKQHVVFVLPPDYDNQPDKRYPVVLAFAGLGESKRGNKAGAWGWVEKYGVVPAMAALHRGTLTTEDFQGLIQPDELQAYNEVLAQTPYRGVILVCPWPPNVLKGRSPARPDFERFLLEELLPYTDRTLRTMPGPTHRGVDGISLGGLLSTWMGVRYPEHFTAIGSQQASVGSYPRLLDKMIREKQEVFTHKAINVATSHQDPFRKSLMAFHQRLNQAKVPHRFTVLQGRHNKRFVKGPGSVELLLFQDRALWGSGQMPPAKVR